MAPELEPITLKLQGDIADSHRIDAFQLADTINGWSADPISDGELDEITKRWQLQSMK